MIIHINGMPGVGKMTVARELCARCRKQGMETYLVDNHLMHNIPIALTAPDSAEYWSLFRAARDLVYARVRVLPRDAVIIMTNAHAVGVASNTEQIDRLMELVAARGDTLHPVLLLCDLAENQRRVSGGDRMLNRKQRSPEKIAEYHEKIKLWHPKDGIAFDTTKATPDYVAQKVFEAVFKA